jgi:hypothetical protein
MSVVATGCVLIPRKDPAAAAAAKSDQPKEPATRRKLGDNKTELAGERSLEIINKAAVQADVFIRAKQNVPFAPTDRRYLVDVTWGLPWDSIEPGQSAVFKLKDGTYDLMVKTAVDSDDDTQQIISHALFFPVVDARPFTIIVADESSRKAAETAKGAEDKVIVLSETARAPTYRPAPCDVAQAQMDRYKDQCPMFDKRIHSKYVSDVGGARDGRDKTARCRKWLQHMDNDPKLYCR